MIELKTLLSYPFVQFFQYDFPQGFIRNNLYFDGLIGFRVRNRFEFLNKRRSFTLYGCQMEMPGGQAHQHADETVAAEHIVFAQIPA